MDDNGQSPNTLPKSKKRYKKSHGEGTIVERPDGRWMAQVTIAPYKRKTVYGITYEEAYRKMEEVKKSLREKKI